MKYLQSNIDLSNKNLLDLYTRNEILLYRSVDWKLYDTITLQIVKCIRDNLYHSLHMKQHYEISATLLPKNFI
jgi:hypothetical protein